jgi:hypothetical protein
MRIGLTGIFVDDQDQSERCSTQVLDCAGVAERLKAKTRESPRGRWTSRPTIERPAIGGEGGQRRQTAMVGGEAALGGLLVLLGMVVLLGQAVDLEVGGVGWPFFVILPGLGLLGLGLAMVGRLGEILAMVGGVVTMAGLVLGVQNATDAFETWAYAWALVVLVGGGIGRWLVGVVRGRGDLAVSGGWLIAAGLVAFLGLAVLFEVVIGIDGRGYGAGGRYGLAALLILAGLVLLGRRLLVARRRC